MIGSLKSLEQLEGLVKRASEALQKSATETRSLREKLTRLEAEHKKVKEELKETKMTLARHQRLRSRLVRLSEKLERVG